jgi:hypothetical protein
MLLTQQKLQTLFGRAIAEPAEAANVQLGRSELRRPDARTHDQHQ